MRYSLTARPSLTGGENLPLLRPEDLLEENNGNTSTSAESPATKAAAAASASASADATGQATVAQTVLNLMKACMGTGYLALPFAANEGGIVLYSAGMILVAAWSIYAVQRLCACLEYIPSADEDNFAVDPSSTVLLASDDELSWQDSGGSSSGCYDSCATTTTTTGATGPDAAGSSEKPPRPQQNQQNGQQQRNGQQNQKQEQQQKQQQQQQQKQQQKRVSSVVWNKSHPPAGTATFGRVAWYAFGNEGLEVVDTTMLMLLMGIATAYLSAMVGFLSDTPYTLGRVPDAILAGLILFFISLVPDIGFLSNFSAVGLAALLASFVIIAGYGVTMYDPSTYETAMSSLTVWPASVTGVSRWFGCVAFGFGVAPLTYNFSESMKRPNLMVPATTVALSTVAVAYIGAGLGLYFLYPAVAGEVLHELPSQGMLPVITRLTMVGVALMTAPLLIVPCGELLEGKLQTTNRVAVRFGICSVLVCVSVLLPSFVQVLALVGCACVGFVGFCLPPVFHLRLTYLSGKNVDRRTVVVDSLFLAWGLVATIISSIYTASS